ncbi:hypothetical protein FIU94_07300 [Sulfitobacter sp. THAF37]|uniref:DUF1800 domain-containing protein n=1 Tax=Sulfitobacter sp. THAF37 TaxID=2587855 RepID=UPI0012A9FCCD|nr:DUF1800 domain-containing protein [Sulfitobacter sp. THAF37]QFT58627.1 hypothetical protein FIU94_07300 [Sulfitobacter sp. THAF37]
MKTGTYYLVRKAGSGDDMGFSPHLAERRFGYGRSPSIAPPENIAGMLGRLRGKDLMAERFPVPGFRQLQDGHVVKARFDAFARKKATTPEQAAEAREKSDEIEQRFRHQQLETFAQQQLRRIHSKDNFRERLVDFWSDHFTAQGKSGLLKLAIPAYVEEAVRPHVSGRFVDMLSACITHPVMLEYLDQSTSVGPNSKRGRRKGNRRGLNENLARELLELHTLGVGAAYSQTDVRQMAELLTGLTRTRDYSFVFRKGWAEPGAETVLGKTYSDQPGMQPIRNALSDLAMHPSTARHLAGKLAVHFISDTPTERTIGRLTRTYLDSDGDLMAVYEALLNDPAAWDSPPTNIRPPLEYMSTALRALAVPPDRFAALTPKETLRWFLRPLKIMGQDWDRVSGPDGWPETDAAWVTPQGVAARLDWAMNVPARLLDDLPDPQQMLQDIVGPDATDALKFAASAAETQAVGVGLILISPALQRR